MSKYDQELTDIKENSIYGNLLEQITPGSTILECGCASGYLTQHFKNDLKCNVSIVEINPEDYKIARKYADDGFHGDLNKTGWLDYYKYKKFDYIIFTEVLEHLYNPEEVIKSVCNLLKDDGLLMFSIPNICHGDIIIKLFYDYFTYTDTGLLDNTHVHFWGLNNIIPFCKRAGYEVLRVFNSLVQMGRTEQAMNFYPVDPQLTELLKKRPHNNVYQYLVICKKIKQE